MSFGARFLSLVAIAVGCGGAAGGPTHPVVADPNRVPGPNPAGVIVETSAGGDHGGALVPVWRNDPRWGDWDAPVTIVAFGDLECPFTARVAPTLAALEEQYGPKKLRVIWKHLPLAFHAAARGAAEAAATVSGLGGNEAFWKFVKRALAAQKDLEDESYAKWAEAAGVSRAAYQDAMSSKRFASKVDDDLAVAEKVGATGTPAFRINGVALSGSQPIEEFQKVVDAELAKAQSLLALGARPADVYVARTNQNAAEKPPDPTPAPQDLDETVWQVPVFPDDPTEGPADALVTVVVFSDFQCPFCQRVLPTLKQLMDAHPGQIRLVWKDNPLPFHPGARPSALLARFAYERLGNEGFWAAHDKLFASQPKLEEDDLRLVAESLGLPWDDASKAIEKTGSKKLEQSVDLAYDVEARGTPHFFFNGVRLSGAQPLEQFEQLFALRRARAEVLVGSGVARASLYATTIKDGRTASQPKRVEVPAPDATTPVRGAATAPVVIQVFSDFQCPFCQRVLETLRDVEREYRGRVRLVFRHNPLPFHKDAGPAAEAAQEVFAQKGTAAFWRYHDALFAAQATPDGLSRSNLEHLAQGQRVDLPRFQQALDTHKHLPKVESDLQAAKDAGITGTPTFVINGYVLSGAQPIQAFRRLVMLALQERRGEKAKTKVVP